MAQIAEKKINKLNAISKQLYYNPNKLLSYNRVLNFVIGARGVGKTYSLTKHVVKRFLKTGEQFIYLRRYKSELKNLPQFFKALIKEGDKLAVEHTLEVKNRELLVDKKVAGYAIPLSTAAQIKGNTYPNVTTIFFDEFLIEKSNMIYLQNEPEKLLNLMDTVIRNRDNATCICLSNAVTISNPYFLYFDLEPDANQEFTSTEDICIEIISSKQFAKQRSKTRFGKLIRKTSYGKFALDNTFVNDSDTFILEKSSESRFIGSIKNDGIVLGIWQDYDAGLIFCSLKNDPNYTPLALTTKDHNINTLLIDNYRKYALLNQLVRAYKHGYLRFDSQTIKHNIMQALKSFNIR